MRPPRFVESTPRGPGRKSDEAARREPALVLVHHPDLRRVGERIRLPADAVTPVSRLAPTLVAADGSETGPVDDPYVSRQPIEIVRLPGGMEIVDPSGVGIAIGGTPVAPGARRPVTDAELARGLDIVVAGRVVWWLTTEHDLDLPAEPGLGIVGHSTAARRLRAEIRAVADWRGPVLVVGETGAGKELVAHALHGGGPRAGGPFVAVNVAAIPAAVAAAELFGHEKGAFTGASERRAGYLERATGGVLFLDEIGELPDAVQPMLLRAIETGEIQPVGGEPRTVDVRIVAATDADLAAAVSAGRFRKPLYYRLATAVVTVPPLRERGVDIGLLLARFLVESLPAPLVDQTTDDEPRLPAPLVAELLRAPWPGNVRQLRNAALRLASIARAGRVAALADLEPLLALDPEPELGPPPTAVVDDDALVDTLRRYRFQLNRTAEALGISRTHLDALIAKSARVRKAKDVTADEITACAARLGGDVDAIAAELEVSPRGLRLRIRQLGLALG